MLKPFAKWRLIRALAQVSTLLVLVPTSLRANCEMRCSCAFAPAPSMIASSAIVFWGEVTRIVPASDTRVGRAVVTVFRSWKGVDAPTINIDLANSPIQREADMWWTAGLDVGVYESGGAMSWSSCDFSPRLHDTLLVFAGRWSSGQLRAHTCGILSGARAQGFMDEVGGGRSWSRPASYRLPPDDSVLVRALRGEVRSAAPDVADRELGGSDRANAFMQPLPATSAGADVRSSNQVQTQTADANVRRAVDEQIIALQGIARRELRRDGNLDSALSTVARLEAIAPTRVVAELLLELARDATYHRPPIPARMPALRRAVALSDQVDSVYADNTRLQAVEFIVRSDPGTAVTLATEIRSSAVRDRAASSIVRRQVWLDVGAHLDTALVTSPLLRDSLYVVIAAQQASREQGAMAMRTAGRIATRALRAWAISEIAASYDGRNDTPVSQMMLREALGDLDPHADYVTLATKAIPAMIGSGDLAFALTWARGHTGNAGAWARLAIIRALIPCQYGASSC